jgi:hypothetical protein
MRRIIATVLLAMATLTATTGPALAGDGSTTNGGGIPCCRN